MLLVKKIGECIMTQYSENKLSVRLPVRMNPAIYRLLENLSWEERTSTAALCRTGVVMLLQSKGIKIPEPMNGWKKLDIETERRKAEEKAQIDKCFIPIP